MKTRLWTLGAFPTVRKDRERELEIVVKGEMSEDPGELLDVTEVSKPSYVRSGPNRQEQRLLAYIPEKPNHMHDQAIFLHYLKAKTRLLGPLHVKAHAEPPTLPRPGPDVLGGSVLPYHDRWLVPSERKTVNCTFARRYH